MRVYRVSHTDESQGCVLDWCLNKRAAEHSRRQILTDYKDEPDDYVPEVEIRPVDLPQTKKALVGWLNRNFNRDNG